MSDGTGARWPGGGGQAVGATRRAGLGAAPSGSRARANDWRALVRPPATTGATASPVGPEANRTLPTHTIPRHRRSVDTERFYKALAFCGTDFTLIALLFPGRDRWGAASAPGRAPR